MSWKITLLCIFRSKNIYFPRKGPIKKQLFETFECSDQNWPMSCHFWEKKCFSSNFASFFSVMRCKIVMQNFNKTWPCGFKNDMRNWVSFHWSTQSLKNCTVMGSFCQKHIIFQLGNFRGIMCHDTEGWYKL